jgi:hypothetical protein
MPGTKLFSLLDKLQTLSLHHRMHLFGSMTRNHNYLLGFERTASVDHMPQQGLAGQFMDHLGTCRLHARSLTCGENDNT